MVIAETIEGTVNGSLWFHYDVPNDVLYLRFVSQRGAETVGDETPEGFILLRRADNDEPVGLTVVNWWKRFGKGLLPDSWQAIGKAAEPFAARIAA